MNEALDLFKQHAWAPLSILVMLWLYRALASDSSFPVSIPAKWKPLAIISLGQIIAVTKAIAISHVVWYVAVSNGLIIGFMALGGVHMLKLWWPVEGSEPKWLKVLVLVFDDLTKIAPAVIVQATDSKPRAMMFDDEGMPTIEVPLEPVTKKELPKS